MMTGKAAGTAKGSPLRQRMIDQMRIANLAESTQIAYLFEIERLAKHYGTSPADLDGEQLRDWILKLIDRGLSPSSTNSTLAAFRFFYVETLGCPERVAGLRNRKKPQALPRHMTEQEVERLILATPDLRHRAAFIAAYGAGLRVSETVNVKIADIKADRKCLHIPSGKGGTERMAPLANGVIHYLRGYYKNIWPQPATWHSTALRPMSLCERRLCTSPSRRRATRSASIPVTPSTACVIRPPPICLSEARTSK